MQRIDLKQARSWCRILLAGWLLAGLAPSAQSGLFTGALDYTHWEQVPTDNSGIAGFTENNTVLRIDSMSGSTEYSITMVELKSPYLSTGVYVSFDWTLTANGNADNPIAKFYVGESLFATLSGDSSASLTHIKVPAYTPITFVLYGQLIEVSGKSPAQLIISGGGWEVPEAGNALAGLLVLGAAGFEWFRRKQTAGV